MRASALWLALSLSACAQAPGETFVSSDRSAIELRAMQSRVIDGSQNTVARGVVATLQDLGYRITRVDAGSGTISATKSDRLRLAAVVRGQDAGRSVVRANAAILVPPAQVREVDAAEFYQTNFFGPLAATLGQEAFGIGAEQPVPDAVRPDVGSPPEQQTSRGQSR